MKGSIKKHRWRITSTIQIGIRLIVFAVVLLSSIPAIGEVRLVATDDHGLTIEYLPELITTPVDPVRSDPATESEIVRLSLKNADIRSIPGMLEIPISIISVAVPAGSRPSARLLAYKSGQVWNGSLPTNTTDHDRMIQLGGRTADDLLPLIEAGTAVGKLKMRTLSGLQVVRIPVYPVKIRHHPEQVELAKRIVIRIDFNVSSERPVQRSGQPVWNRIIQRPNRLARSVILNADQAVGWRRVTTSNFTEPSWPQGFPYRFTIEREGIYSLTFDDLIAKGVDMPRDGVISDRLKLFGNGGGELPLEPDEEAPLGLSECALHIDDGDDGIFNSGDRLLFYGRGAGGWMYDPDGGYRYEINHYALKNVYWLNIDPSGGGLRMDSFHLNIEADTTSSNGLIRYYYEPDEFIYNRDGFVGSGRQWYGYTFDGPSIISFNVPVDAPVTTLSARLKVRLVRTSSTRTWIDVGCNYTNIGGFSPMTPSSYGVQSFSITPHITDGTNIISFEQTHPSAKSLFDWLEVSYYGSLDRQRIFEAVDYTGAIRYDLTGLNDPWIFDVTDHSEVRIDRRESFTVLQEGLSPHRYIVRTADRFMSVSSDFDEYFPPESDIVDLWSETNRYDVLLITPDGYWDAVEPLKDHYAGGDPVLRAARVRLSEIYNRFSGGLTNDPAAIRNMLMFANERWAKAPDYVVFCGDGDYNYRNIGRPVSENFLPPFEYGGYCYDDWFVDFTPQSQDNADEPLPEMIHGRLTARSTYEMRNIVEKIIAYVDQPEFGLWRNRITLVADDEYGDQRVTEYDHVQYTEDISTGYIPSWLNQDKIYLTEYEPQWGREKTQAADDLVELINRGTLLVNYMGHGNPTLWAHEHVFVQSRDVPRLERSRRLPLYLAFTCDWGYWDDPTAHSFPEQLLTEADRGAIGVIASTRLTFSSSNAALAKRFFWNLFSVGRTTVGEALAQAKWEAASPLSATYHLLGDPTMYLAYPRRNGEFTSLSQPLTPLSVSSVEGTIYGAEGHHDSDFTGEVEFLTLDTKIPRRYAIRWIDAQGEEREIILNYVLSGPTVYRGLFSAERGRFNGQFVVPRDVTLGSDLGRVVAYFHNGEIDGVMARDSVEYANQVAVNVDDDPPDIQIYFDHRGFRPGDPIGNEPLLIVDIADSSGLNLTGAMGHGVSLSVDGGEQVDLTPFFSYNLDDYQSGNLERRIGPLDVGHHRVEIEAWDSFNNISVEEIEVEVTASNDGLAVYNVLNWPNPFNETTQLTFLVNGDGDYEILLFTVGGRLIKRFRGQASQGFNAVEWNGLDLAGRNIANGVYLYKVIVRDIQGRQAEGLGRIAYIR